MPEAAAAPQANQPTWAGRFWRLAFVQGVTFGLLQIPVDAFLRTERGLGYHLGMFAFRSAAFGLVTAAWVVRVSRRTVKTAQPPPIRAVRTISLPCDRESGIRQVRAAVLRIPKASLSKADPETGTLIAKTGSSRWPRGEIITAEVRGIGPEECTVRLESRPRTRLTLEDCGANMRNLDMVEAALRA